MLPDEVTPRKALKLLKKQFTVNYKGFIELSYRQAQMYLAYNRWCDSVEVEGFHVWPESQGKGHGKRAMDQVCRWADQYHVQLCLRVEAYKNEALNDSQLLRFYRSFGFKGNKEHMKRIAS